MFRGLTNFSYQRTPLQAFGWYLTFLLSIFVIAVVIGGSLEFFDIEQTFEGAYLDVQVVMALVGRRGSLCDPKLSAAVGRIVDRLAHPRR